MRVCRRWRGLTNRPTDRTDVSLRPDSKYRPGSSCATRRSTLCPIRLPQTWLSLLHVPYLTLSLSLHSATLSRFQIAHQDKDTLCDWPKGENKASKQKTQLAEPPVCATRFILPRSPPPPRAHFNVALPKLLLESRTPILPDSRFASRGSDFAVHMIVDRKNRVYACVAVDDVPPKVAFSFLEEVRACRIGLGGGGSGRWRARGGGDDRKRGAVSPNTVFHDTAARPMRWFNSTPVGTNSKARSRLVHTITNWCSKSDGMHHAFRSPDTCFSRCFTPPPLVGIQPPPAALAAPAAPRPPPAWLLRQSTDSDRVSFQGIRPGIFHEGKCT